MALTETDITARAVLAGFAASYRLTTASAQDRQVLIRRAYNWADSWTEERIARAARQQAAKDREDSGIGGPNCPDGVG